MFCEQIIKMWILQKKDGKMLTFQFSDSLEKELKKGNYFVILHKNKYVEK